MMYSLNLIISLPTHLESHPLHLLYRNTDQYRGERVGGKLMQESGIKNLCRKKEVTSTETRPFLLSTEWCFTDSKLAVCLNI